ncbi:SOS response-associated peptidase [Nguyenibacter sp. L1]|uniref:SOS response-associated peptidase n=1 Tax=Nguyenibacter sp. L1 TaxID=3049350 RepID=UPI002B45A8C6|nr:SOS response-associated peptidase [Nguyenibacter sp. L1]WRH86591.1 SOS response-associated peptidase [Nguyenibacter sp. L1]
MCRRFANALTTQAMRQHFGVTGPAPDWLPSWNVAPGQPAPVFCRVPSGSGTRLDLMLWGLVPHWARDMTRQAINARAETIATSGMFRAAFRARRCLVPATACYLWPTGRTPRLARCPWALTTPDRQPMTLAAIWDNWEYQGDILHSFAIITTESCESVRPVQDRMPVLIAPDDRRGWLYETPDNATRFLMPCDPDNVTLFPVGPAVNDPTRNGPHLLDPAQSIDK